MDKIWGYTFLSILIVSLMSLSGIVLLILNKSFFKKIQSFLVSFAVGSLLGGAFLHIIPEAFMHAHDSTAPILVVSSIVVFFILEKYFHLYRHHKVNGNGIKTFGPMNLIADAMHNFLDGILIAAAFSVDINTGIVATVAVIGHELPQEIGDFAVLVQSGYSTKKALLLNLLSACTAFLGAAIILIFPIPSHQLSELILPLAAGGFIYIALAELIPELNSEKSVKNTISQITALILGLFVMYMLEGMHDHGMHH